MKNKVLIKLYVPELSDSYELFIPVNELIWKITKLISKSLNDLTDCVFPLDKQVVLMNKNSGKIYDYNDIVIDTDIRNSTELILIVL